MRWSLSGCVWNLRSQVLCLRLLTSWHKLRTDSALFVAEVETTPDARLCATKARHAAHSATSEQSYVRALSPHLPWAVHVKWSTRICQVVKRSVVYLSSLMQCFGSAFRMQPSTVRSCIVNALPFVQFGHLKLHSLSYRASRECLSLHFYKSEKKNLVHQMFMMFLCSQLTFQCCRSLKSLFAIELTLT